MTETEVLYEVWREVKGVEDPRQFLKGMSEQLRAERFVRSLQHDIDEVTPPGTATFYVVKATTTRERVT